MGAVGAGGGVVRGRVRMERGNNNQRSRQQREKHGSKVKGTQLRRKVRCLYSQCMLEVRITHCGSRAIFRRGVESTARRSTFNFLAYPTFQHVSQFRLPASVSDSSTRVDRDG